ncbi:hypothetical protein RFI_24934 [Reticulomyxa filosa]|uniref:Urocanate hydratase n=1 Tax=Reticulomyxa filosa TaxID=46433 RepID=X6MEL6_RETFI|nr:hypothetical protein RFI_24934 [Reticulomyxa filosa]|eukprot:ETO12443.1 hypothetical protein RFI_24934 [Reticulomyxa filosa]
MSGAQGKASMVCECVGIIAEVDEQAVKKRFKQGWVQEVISDLDKLIQRVRIAKQKKKPLQLHIMGKEEKKNRKRGKVFFFGSFYLFIYFLNVNVVDLWEKLAGLDDMLVELGSDQTSLHNPFNGGYYPVGYSLEEAQKLMMNDPKQFKIAVEKSLQRQVKAINKLVSRGMRFWDYGNCFLLESSRAGADVMNPDNNKLFRYPSYVQDIMGDIFSLGFGPFRWVCTSGKESDLAKSDVIAEKVLRDLRKKEKEIRVQGQLDDNIFWIHSAMQNKLVVGSQARILYAHAMGRVNIAVALNEAIARGHISGPIVLSRDHHDVSGTDSPFRETSNIYDGSAFCADMAVQNFAGDAFRGATWIALHNGGGVGWGEVINGGFGLVLDGTKEARKRAEEMLYWDVNNGIARRAWSGNENAQLMITRVMNENQKVKVTMPNSVTKSILDKACNNHSRL